MAAWWRANVEIKVEIFRAYRALGYDEDFATFVVQSMLRCAIRLGELEGRPYDAYALSEKLLMPRSTVTRHLTRLEDVGFIDRYQQGRSRMLKHLDCRADVLRLELLRKYVWPDLTVPLDAPLDLGPSSRCRSCS